MWKSLNSVLTLRSRRRRRLEEWHQLRARPSFETGASRPPQDEVGYSWLVPLCAALSLISFSVDCFAADRKLGIGRTATPAEIAGWDIDVRPDGQGLPPGKGSVKEGEQVYMGKCAACHGEFGESAGRWPQIAGGTGSLKSDDPVKTVGSYFAHLSTVIDYVRRAMPFGDAQSLSHDELYAVVAYMLFLNDLVDEKFVLSRETYTQVKMPNAGGFYDDDRETTEKAFWNPKPCMADCKPDAKITGRARVIDVTPDEKALRRGTD
jgi:S-disulfanyl-L-cysteine oxidoreductase SoxD